ncbi:MAG: hypothetical protein HY202_03435 [Nitrospirae bacterium]|nr:hypothetical protein [Nitrospirota bacterium]
MKRIFFIFVMLWIQTVLFAGTSAADPPRQIEYQAGLDLRYSDNVIYTYNISTQVITTSGDFIYEPYFTVKFRTPGLTSYPARIVLSLSDNIYSKYSPINYQTWSLLLEQKMDPKTFFGLKYTLIPYLFAGEEDILQSGQSGIDTSLSLRLNILTAIFDRDFAENKNIYLYAKYANKDYNTPIVYRSAIVRTFGGDLTIKWNRATTAMAGLSYETNEAEKGMRTLIYPLPTGSVTFNDDFSYTAPAITLLLIEHLSAQDTLRFKVTHKSRSFTVDSSEPLHGGRNDQINDFLIANAYKITAQWTWKLSYALYKRDSNRSYANFTENAFLTGVDFSFK